MSKNIQSDNPDVAAQESGEDEVTEADLINSLSKNLSALTESEEKSEESETEQEEEAEVDTEEEADGEEEETEEEEESEDDDVLSQIDVDSLTKEQKVELAQILGSSLGSELGKMRSENRSKDAKIAQLEAELSDGISKLLPSDNQFSSITSSEDLEAKRKEIDQNIEAASNFLGGDEDYITVGNEEIDRKTVSSWLRSYLKQKEDIPKQMARIKEMSSLGESSSKEIESLKSELTWLDDSESEAYKSYEKLKGDSDLDLLKRISPKLAIKLEGILAHAANSMAGKPAAKKKFLLPSKPKAISGKLGAASSSKPSKAGSKKVEAARKRILSGEVTEDDIITAAFR